MVIEMHAFRLKIRLLATLLAVASAGCFGSLSEPSRRFYTLHLEPMQHVIVPHIQGLCRVRDLDADAAYDRFQFVIRRSPFELLYRSSDVWAVKPNRMVSDLLARGLTEQNIFSGVTRELAERRPDYLMSGELHAIEVYDSGDTWFAHISISLQMTHFETGKILWTFNYDDRKEVTPDNFSHAVRALSELLSSATEKALRSMEHMRSPEDVGTQDLEAAPYTRPIPHSTDKPPEMPQGDTPDAPIFVPESPH